MDYVIDALNGYCDGLKKEEKALVGRITYLLP